MIKVQATINGIISKSATIRMAGDGKKFIGFPVKLTVPGSRNNMPGKELTVSVSKDGDESELPSLAAGTRIEATGTLTFRKTGDNLYFNVSIRQSSSFKLALHCLPLHFQVIPQVKRTINICNHDNLCSISSPKYIKTTGQ